MDIEGAELEAIEGARPILVSTRPRFAIASYHLREGRSTAARLETIFRELRYDVVTEFPSHLTTYATPQPL